jgi:hypothetical protein
LAVLFAIVVSTPQACNDGSSGNALSVHDDAEGDKFEASEDNQQTLPIDERFMFEEKFAATRSDKQVGANPFPKIAQEKLEQQAIEFNIRPVMDKPGEKFNRIHTGSLLKKKNKTKVGKRLGGKIGKKGLVGKTVGGAGNAVDKTLLNGKKIINAGKIQFVELNEKMREQCLKDYFFCSVSCADDFKMTCTPDAQIFSTFVTRDQHANICVKPRVHEINRKLLPLKKRVEARKQCILRPCGCKAYESKFVNLYGKSEFDRALKILQGMCFKWCTTGKKPAGVIDKNQAMEAIESVKQALLAAYRKLYAWMGKFLDFGKVAFEHTKKAAIFVGNNIKKGAQIVGKGVQQGARVVGKAFGGAAKHTGRFFGGAAKKTGRAFRGAARRVGRFFRRFRRW